jgi:hypothetical protein
LVFRRTRALELSSLPRGADSERSVSDAFCTGLDLSKGVRKVGLDEVADQQDDQFLVVPLGPGLNHVDAGLSQRVDDPLEAIRHAGYVDLNGDVTARSDVAALVVDRHEVPAGIRDRFECSEQFAGFVDEF